MITIYTVLASLALNFAYAQSAPSGNLCQLDFKDTGLVDIYIVPADNVGTNAYGQKIAIDPSRRNLYKSNYLFRNHLHDELKEMDRNGLCNASEAILDVRWQMNPEQPSRMTRMQPTEGAPNVDKTLTTSGLNLSAEDRAKLEAARKRLLELPSSADDVAFGIHRNFACLMLQAGLSFGTNLGVCVEATTRHTPTTAVLVGWGMKGAVLTAGLFRLEYIGELSSLNGDSFASGSHGSGGAAIGLGASGEFLSRDGATIEISGLDVGLGLIGDMEGYRIKVFETTTTGGLRARVQEDGFYLP